jgi:predicted  nucleic acid-binding Zn-ribbon protein
MATAPAVSASVSEGLVRSLQAEITGLRDENHEIVAALEESQAAAKAARAEAAEAAEETARMRQRLERAEKGQAAAAAEASAAVTGGEELERELVAALADALGAAPGATWEDAAGAARRRVSKTSSSIVAAAVKTARRAQATWVAEHSKLRDEADEAKRTAAKRATELDEAREIIRRLKAELAALRRRAEQEQEQRAAAELRYQEPPVRPVAVPLPASTRHTAPREPPMEHVSAFSAFMEAKAAQKGAPPAPRGGAARADAAAPSFSEPPPPPPRQPSGGTRLPSLTPPATTPPADSAQSAALRAMTDALQAKWSRHVSEQRGTRPMLVRR